MELLIKLNNNLSIRHIHSSNNIGKSTKTYFLDSVKQEQVQLIHYREQQQPKFAAQLASLVEVGNLENLLNVKNNCLTGDNGLIL